MLFDNHQVHDELQETSINHRYQDESTMFYLSSIISWARKFKQNMINLNACIHQKLTKITKKEQYDWEWFCLNTFSEKLCMIIYICQYSQDNNNKHATLTT